MPLPTVLSSGQQQEAAQYSYEYILHISRINTTGVDCGAYIGAVPLAMVQLDTCRCKLHLEESIDVECDVPTHTRRIYFYYVPLLLLYSVVQHR